VEKSMRRRDVNGSDLFRFFLCYISKCKILFLIKEIYLTFNQSTTFNCSIFCSIWPNKKVLFLIKVKYKIIIIIISLRLTYCSDYVIATNSVNEWILLEEMLEISQNWIKYWYNINKLLFNYLNLCNALVKTNI